MAKRKKKTDYRALKKVLNQYYDFTFKMPRAGKDFSPQQKSAITRKYNKIKEYIDNDSISWIKYPDKSKLPKVDSVRTTKGLFYKYPGAVAKYSKKDKKYHIVVQPKLRKGLFEVSKRRDVLFLFPQHVLMNPALIPDYVNALRDKYNPDEIRWSIQARRESQAYDESLFNFYFSINVVDTETGEEFEEDELTDEEILEMPREEQTDIWKKRKYEWKREDDPHFYNGVFLIYYINEAKKARTKHGKKRKSNLRR